MQARLKQSTHHHQLEEVEALQKTVSKLSVQYREERIIAWKLAANYRLKIRSKFWERANHRLKIRGEFSGRANHRLKICDEFSGRANSRQIFREERIIAWKFAANFREERITCIVKKFARIQTIGINQSIVKVITKLRQKKSVKCRFLRNCHETPWISSKLPCITCTVVLIWNYSVQLLLLKCIILKCRGIPIFWTSRLLEVHVNCSSPDKKKPVFFPLYVGGSKNLDLLVHIY